MKVFSFENLEAWKEARKLNLVIYRLTRQFPSDEKFGLVSQLRRASVSVSSNISEGNSRFSPNDKARFFEISYSSLMEVLNQLILSLDLGYISEEDFIAVRKDIEKTASMINGLRNHFKK
jgi:four helix bundle protein